MLTKRSVWFILLAALAWAGVGCGASEADRQEDVAQAGSEVMPFDLERSAHVFQKLDSGGLQQVLSDDEDPEQIDLIRAHLAEEAERFSQGDFDDPALIHGGDMAGLQELSQGAERLSIIYTELQNGGQILFTTQDSELVAAIHAWFDQQLADHGEHAQAMAAGDMAGEGAGSGMGMGMGMMGNSSMRTAHHATIPEAYAALSNPVAADQASLDRGGEIFVSSCAVCHGDGGMGDGPGSANLDPAVSPIAQTSQMLSDAYLFWRVSEGGQGDPLTSAMPTWKGVLDEQARWDVINYVQALGQGTVQPRQSVGGATFDPAVEQQNRREMLADAMESGLIEQAQADTFDRVHSAMDGLMVETGLRMQGNNMPALLAILVERDEITPEEADSFTEVHDLLLAAGLMR